MKTFCFNCPQCSQQLEAEEDMRGLVVMCSHCEKGIVVPKLKSSSSALNKPKKLALGGGRSCGVQGTDAVNPNFASIQRRIAEQESELQKENELKKKMHSANRRQAMFSAFFRLTTLVVICGGTFWGWNTWRNAKKMEIAAIKAAEDFRIKSEEYRLKDENERCKIEQEKRKEELERRRLEHEKNLAVKNKLRQEQAIASKKQQEEKEWLRKERIAAEEKFSSLMKSFSGLQADIWRRLPKNSRPGNFEGIFHVLVPGVDSGEAIYEIKSHSNGSLDVCKLSRQGEKPVERDVYEKDVIKNGGMVIISGKAYIVSPQKSAGNLFPVPDSRYWTPSEIVLDGLSLLIRKYRIDTSGLVFGVSYVMPDDKSMIRIESMPYNANLTRRQILDKVTQYALKTYRPPKAKIKVKRPTVVFYDGRILKKGMNGVTYVPRNPSPENLGRNYFNYAQEARRQERLAEDAKREAEHAEQEARANFIRRIADTFGAGRIKIEILEYGRAASR